MTDEEEWDWLEQCAGALTVLGVLVVGCPFLIIVSQLLLDYLP